MSLWRRPSGIYESHIMVDGVRYRKSTGTSNKRLAERIDRKTQEELLARRFQVEEHEFIPTMKFAELVTRFLPQVQSLGTGNDSKSSCHISPAWRSPTSAKVWCKPRPPAQRKESHRINHQSRSSVLAPHSVLGSGSRLPS